MKFRENGVTGGEWGNKLRRIIKKPFKKIGELPLSTGRPLRDTSITTAYTLQNFADSEDPHHSPFHRENFGDYDKDKMPEGEHSSSQTTNELSDKVQRLRHVPAHELQFVREFDIQEVATKARTASESDKEVARTFFRKVMLSIPSWYPASKYIHSATTDLLYPPEEEIKVEDSRRKAAERQQATEDEIASGTSPWLAHIHQNAQTDHNPYTVGFYQDEEGKIRTIYGERFFRSQRQIVPIFTGRIETKEVNLLTTKFQQIENSQIHRGKYWELLPEELRKRLEGGEILITGGSDAYALSDEKIDELAASINPYALQEHVHMRMQTLPDGYHLLYYSDYQDDSNGRTGVLMQASEGKIKPTTVEIDGKEYIIELKGCGTKKGGFAGQQHRTGRDIITGGAEEEQAINELNRLAENVGTEKPKAGGSITFNNNGYAQGYIIRFTPSTVRASYSGNEAYPQIDTQDSVERVLTMYTNELVAQIYAPNPKIPYRSSHTENILLWGDGRYTFTDFSDHVAFNDTQFPHKENSGGYMTPKQMLHNYIKKVSEIPGYNEGRDKQAFYNSLVEEFQIKGKELSFDVDDSIEAVTQKIWEQGGMAYQVFKARQIGHYVAEGTL